MPLKRWRFSGRLSRITKNLIMLNSNKQIKICFTCSAGGHFKQALKIADTINYRKYFVTYRSPHLNKIAEQVKIYFVTHSKRNPILVLRNAFESLKILLKEKPDLIISTGADVAVPTCILGKLLGKKLVYIESGGQVYTPSLSGRIVYRFADLFMVQWKPGLKNFPKARYGGPLI